MHFKNVFVFVIVFVLVFVFVIVFLCVRSRVVKAPFFKANLKAVSKRLIKAVKRLLYVVNMMNDC